MRYSLSRFLLALFVILPFVSLAKVVFGFPYSSLIFDLLVVLAIFYHFKDIVRIPNDTAYFIILFLIAVSIVQIFNPYDGDIMFKLKGYRSSAFYLIMFLLPLAQRLDPQFMAKFTRVNVVMAVIVALYALRQLLIPLPFEVAYSQLAGTGSTFLGDTYERDENLFRIFGSFSASTHLAAYCLWSFCLSLSAYLTGALRNRWTLLAVLLSIAGMAVTYSRTSIIALPVSAVAILFMYSRLRGGVRGMGMGVLISAGGLGLMAIAASFVPMLGNRLKTIGSADSVSSMASRLLIWQERWTQIKAAPWGYGTGLAGFHDINVQKLVADNQYLKVLIEWGWLAGGLFIVLLALMALKLANAAQKRPNLYAKALCMSGAAYIAGMGVIMMTGQILEAYPIGLMFWYICGLAYYVGLGRGDVPHRPRAATLT